MPAGLGVLATRLVPFKSGSKLTALQTLRVGQAFRVSRQRLECVRLAGAFDATREFNGARNCLLATRLVPFKSGSKLTALQTLRVGQAFQVSRQRLECARLAGSFKRATTGHSRKNFPLAVVVSSG